MARALLGAHSAICVENVGVQISQTHTYNTHTHTHTHTRAHNTHTHGRAYTQAREMTRLKRVGGGGKCRAAGCREENLYTDEQTAKFI